MIISFSVLLNGYCGEDGNHVGDAEMNTASPFLRSWKVGGNDMKSRIMVVSVLMALAVMGSTACATKKYARNRINERVTPLEQRTGELEETSRRNSQDIGQLNEGVNDVRGKVDRVQSQADSALSSAEQANTRVSSTEESVTDLRTNLDKYGLQNTATVNFKFDSFQLTPEAKESLDQLASQITDRNNYILEIQGFADAVGTAAYNDQLTQKRADAVRRYLAEQHNIPLYRMHILGFGEVRPVAENTTREGRAQNRRVEIRLLTRSVTDGANASTTSSTNK